MWKHFTQAYAETLQQKFLNVPRSGIPPSTAKPVKILSNWTKFTLITLSTNTTSYKNLKLIWIRWTNTDRQGNMERNDMLKILWILVTKINWLNCYPSQTPCNGYYFHTHISTLLACRFVPLKKKHKGIRPAGVGEECLRRIIRKAITRFFRGHHAVGTIQTCAGFEAGVDRNSHTFTTFTCQATVRKNGTAR